MSTETTNDTIRLDPVEEAIAAIAAGGIVVVSGMYVRSGRDARQKVDVESGS